MIRFVARTFFSLIALAGLTGTAQAAFVPATWTDEYITTQEISGGSPAQYFHDITYDGFNVGSDIVTFIVREESWVSVTEAGGKSLLQRAVKAGETVGVTGALPLKVVVGRASGVEVRVRGKAFDLVPLARSGGVARFEIKS